MQFKGHVSDDNVAKEIVHNYVPDSLKVELSKAILINLKK